MCCWGRFLFEIYWGGYFFRANETVRYRYGFCLYSPGYWLIGRDSYGCGWLVGGGPTATYFSLLRQRKSKQKKGDRKTCSLRECPLVRCTKWGMKQTRFAQTRFIPDPFRTAHQRLRLKRVNCKSTSKAASQPPSRTMPDNK